MSSAERRPEAELNVPSGVAVHLKASSISHPARQPEIALIAPFPGLAATAGPLLAELPFPVALAEGDLEKGLARGRELLAQGVQVFVSRGGTAQRLKSLDAPVVEIKVTAYDLLSALSPLMAEGRKIGIIGFYNVIAGANRLSELLSYDLAVFAVGHEKEVAVSIAAAKERGVEVVLGDRVVNDLARAAGLRSVLIESGPEAVLDALNEACERLAIIKAETAKNRSHLEVLSLYKTVFEAVEDLIITVDRDGRVDSQNPAAAALFKDSLPKLTPRHLHGRSLNSLLTADAPQYNLLATWGGQKFILDFFPLHIGYDDGPAAVILGRSVRKVEKSERRIRSALYLTGHVARFRFPDLLSKDKNFLDILARAKEYADSDSTILIEGESGTGKEMLAQSIHNHKFGGDEPFVVVNCATLPEPLLESELFGYTRGAFTGARAEGKKGLFELAHGGTLFLDEIGELPLTLQSRLLRVIEERAVFPLGSDRVIPVNVRLIAATNKDLIAAVRENRFRNDLYFRLGVLALTLPPLRERGSDALVIFKALLRGVNKDYKFSGRTEREITALLLDYTWPGNARELKNLVERLAIITGRFTRSDIDLPELLAGEMNKLKRLTARPQLLTSAAHSLEAGAQAPWPEFFPAQPGGGSIGKREMASRLGISRTTLWRRLKELERRDNGLPGGNPQTKQ